MQLAYGASHSSDLSVSQVVWQMMVSAALSVRGHVMCCVIDLVVLILPTAPKVMLLKTNHATRTFSTLATRAL